MRITNLIVTKIIGPVYVVLVYLAMIIVATIVYILGTINEMITGNDDEWNEKN